MKLTAVSNNTIRQNNKNTKAQNPSFKGFTEGLVNTWRIIDSSRGIQFTVEDMLGTNIPRTASGAMSGYEYTKKINWPYLWQEGIREFLTGPTMTAAPIAILAAATKMSGKTANTHVDNIKNLSYIASTIAPKGENPQLTPEAFKETFIRAVVKDAIEKSTGEEVLDDDNDIKILAKQFTIFSEIPAGRKNKKQAKDALGKIAETFENIVKERKASYKDTDFHTAIHSMGKNAKDGSTNIENYAKYTTAFVEDYIKANTKANKKGDIIDLAEKTIEAFKDKWCTKRIGVVTAMVVGTGFIMSFIPKLYTLASGGVNPGGAAIYDEAARREGK